MVNNIRAKLLKILSQTFNFKLKKKRISDLTYNQSGFWTGNNQMTNSISNLVKFCR